MSLLPSSKLYFKDSKFIFKLTSFICVHFVHLEPQEKKIDTKNNNREKKSYLRSLTGTMTTVQFSFCSNPQFFVYNTLNLLLAEIPCFIWSLFYTIDSKIISPRSVFYSCQFFGNKIRIQKIFIQFLYTCLKFSNIIFYFCQFFAKLTLCKF